MLAYRCHQDVWPVNSQISTARIVIAAIAITPTRNCAHLTFLAAAICSIFALYELG